MAQKDYTKGLWKRTGADEMSARKYAVIIGMSFIWAVFLVILGTRIGFEHGYSLAFSLIGFIGAIVGIGIYSGADQPVGSLAGVSLLSFSMGLTIGPILSYYDVDVVLKALALTFAVTVVMSTLGMLFPKAIRGAGGILFAGLAFLLVAWLAQWVLLLFGIYLPMTAIDYVAAALFSLYIWYDWSRAMGLPKTVDNAIDASGALIVDVVNLFITLLRIIARSQ